MKTTETYVAYYSLGLAAVALLLMIYGWINFM